ncbi:MAG: hypothetical protein Phog2KO_48850 [Phototrophicaceae bacterium]
MRIKCLGTYTFDDDETLKKGLDSIKELIQAENSFLTTEHISPLGLHVTIKHSGNADAGQKEACENVLKSLAKVAYSGYVDMTIDDTEPQRFHAKEIGAKEISIEDIASS